MATNINLQLHGQLTLIYNYMSTSINYNYMSTNTNLQLHVN